MLPTRIGICEDDPELRSVLQRALAHEGFDVSSVSTGHEAIERWRARTPDILVLDIGLPDADGRDVCQALRAHGVTAPVLFLTAKQALPDRLSGFHAGGDDYLTKPFAIAELVVRLRALLRRPESRPADPGGDPLRLDPVRHEISHRASSTSLTPTEFRLLAALAARPGEVVRRHELVAAAWPEGAIVHDNTLDAYLVRLRRKLREIESPAEIVTRRGLGYVLE